MCVEYQRRLKEIVFILEGRYSSLGQAVACVCDDGEGSVSICSEVGQGLCIVIAAVVFCAPHTSWCFGSVRRCYQRLCQRAFLGVPILLQLEGSLNGPHRDAPSFCPSPVIGYILLLAICY